MSRYSALLSVTWSSFTDSCVCTSACIINASAVLGPLRRLTTQPPPQEPRVDGTLEGWCAATELSLDNAFSAQVGENHDRWHEHDAAPTWLAWTSAESDTDGCSPTFDVVDRSIRGIMRRSRHFRKIYTPTWQLGPLSSNDRENSPPTGMPSRVSQTDFVESDSRSQVANYDVIPDPGDHAVHWRSSRQEVFL